jgi:EmrB/QacA subfamily drug resistance transporter
MAMMEVTPGSPLTKRQLRLVFLGLMTALLLSALDTNIVSVALPTIVGDLGGLQQIAWVGTAYLLTSTAATPLFGKLSDLYGRRRLYQVAILTFVAGSLLCGIAQSMLQLVLARGVQGVGGGGLMAMAFAVIADVVPARERGRYVGVFTSVFAAASVAGPLLGGFFVDNLNWRWIFVINVPLGAVALIVTSSALHMPFVRRVHKIDVLGSTLLVAAVIAFVIGISWGGEGTFAWGSVPVVGVGLLSLALGTGFVLWEMRAEEPIIPMRLFRNRIFSVIVPMMVFLGSMMFGASAFLPLFFQAVRGVSATESGLLMLPLMAGVTVSSIGSGRLIAISGRYKRWPIIGMGVVVLACGLLAQLEPTTSMLMLAFGMLLLGLGMGSTLPTSTLAVQNAVEFRDMGVATSLVAFFRSLGGAVGLAAYGAVFNAQIVASGVDGSLLQAPDQIQSLPLADQLPVEQAITDGISSIFLLAFPFMVITWVLAWFVKEIPLRETTALAEAAREDAVVGAAVAH